MSYLKLFYLLQEIPQSKPWEKVSGPPILPPHLLQVILNKDTPLSVCIPLIVKQLMFYKTEWHLLLLFLMKRKLGNH